MKSLYHHLSFVGLLVLLIAAAGCNDKTDSSSTPATDASAASDTAGEQGADAHTDADSMDGHQHGHHDHDTDSGAATDMEKMMQGLAGLAEADRESAMKQHFCPVSDEMLGTMGTPIKVTVEGQDVWLCCDGCKKDLEADPQKYLAKVQANQ
ncbi:MAG: hypothetical protein KatS3mg111_4125 [Pirellulaceae bacterium]|nr:MAG: hypothetical protein KatS3mg111_4125 [Pirellulaceae bacterium]